MFWGQNALMHAYKHTNTLKHPNNMRGRERSEYVSHLHTRCPKNLGQRCNIGSFIEIRITTHR